MFVELAQTELKGRKVSSGSSRKTWENDTLAGVDSEPEAEETSRWQGRTSRSLVMKTLTSALRGSLRTCPFHFCSPAAQELDSLSRNHADAPTKAILLPAKWALLGQVTAL